MFSVIQDCLSRPVCQDGILRTRYIASSLTFICCHCLTTSSARSLHRQVVHLWYHLFNSTMFNSFFSKFELCKIRILFELCLFWLWLYAYSILYNMAFMRWCSILGPGRILLLLTACFITFYVRIALQQKQHQCIIYCMRCRSSLSENSGQIWIRDSNTKCMPIEFEFKF